MPTSSNPCHASVNVLVPNPVETWPEGTNTLGSVATMPASIHGMQESKVPWSLSSQREMIPLILLNGVQMTPVSDTGEC